MFRIDFSDLANGFDLLAVANVPTVRKAGEIKVVIDAIKRFTGAPTVILVGHSLGGLARAPTSRASPVTATGAISVRRRRRGADHDLDAEPGQRARATFRASPRAPRIA